MKFLKVFGIVVIILLVGAVSSYFLFFKQPPPPISEEDRLKLELIPLPSSLEFGDDAIILESSIQIESPNNPRLERATKRFLEHFQMYESSESSIRLSISIGNPEGELYPSLDSDESYSISINNGGIFVESISIWGAIHALETIKQLAEGRSLRHVSINDSPRFPWRGLMIDASRHWIPKSVIIENLEAMAKVKLNVLHLHLTDYQGFRMESKIFPDLHKKGANGNFFTQEEMSEVIEFAADRGIRVVPEFDVPGHATSWFVGYPELASAPGPYSVDTTVIGVFLPIMDPTRNEVYDFMSELIAEMAAIFPDRYFHIGGDEANYSHWEENDQIQQFMLENDIPDEHDLQAYFNRRIQSIVASQGKIMAGWDEILNERLPSEEILTQVWRNQSALWESARMGYPTILSAGWYLDHKRTTAEHYSVDPFVIKGGVNIEIDSTDWESWDLTITFNENEFQSELFLFGLENNPRGVMQMMGGIPTSFESASTENGKYTFDIQADIGTINWELLPEENLISGTASLGIINLDVSGTKSGSSINQTGKLPDFKRIEPLDEDQKKLILGGETCMWTEMVDSVTINSRIWPRAAVIAEKLWSDPSLANNVNDIYRRLMAFDEKLKKSSLNHYSRINHLGMQMAPEGKENEFQQLQDLLEEDKMFNRMMIYPNNVITRSIKLNRLVDAARAESYDAYEFGLLIDKWIESSDKDTKDQIQFLLTRWQQSQTSLLEQLTKESEAYSHAVSLQRLSNVGLIVLEGNASQQEIEEFELQSEKASEASSAVVLAVAPHFKRWAESL